MNVNNQTVICNYNNLPKKAQENIFSFLNSAERRIFPATISSKFYEINNKKDNDKRPSYRNAYNAIHVDLLDKKSHKMSRKSVLNYYGSFNAVILETLKKPAFCQLSRESPKYLLQEGEVKTDFTHQNDLIKAIAQYFEIITYIAKQNSLYKHNLFKKSVSDITQLFLFHCLFDTGLKINWKLFSGKEYFESINKIGPSTKQDGRKSIADTFVNARFSNNFFFKIQLEMPYYDPFFSSQINYRKFEIQVYAKNEDLVKKYQNLADDIIIGDGFIELSPRTAELSKEFGEIFQKAQEKNITVAYEWIFELAHEKSLFDIKEEYSLLDVPATKFKLLRHPALRLRTIKHIFACLKPDLELLWWPYKAEEYLSNELKMVNEKLAAFPVKKNSLDRTQTIEKYQLLKERINLKDLLKYIADGRSRFVDHCIEAWKKSDVFLKLVADSENEALKKLVHKCIMVQEHKNSENS